MKIKEYEDYAFLKLTSDSSATRQSIKLVKNYLATMQDGKKRRRRKKSKVSVNSTCIRVERFFNFFEFVLVIVEQICTLMRK